MKKVALLACAISLVACQQKNTPSTTETTPTATENVEVKSEELSTMVFRSDGFHNGVASEWMEVAFKENGEVASIWFWTTESEDKMKVEISEQRIGGGDGIAVNIGKVKFPKNPFVYEFHIQEELFSLTDEDGNTQEFEHEREEF